MDGMINVCKEAGFTSHDVVAKLRGIAGQKKIGHTGTLDPDAVGVLVVCLGNATRACDMITDRSKAYEAEMLLGVVTDTQDTTGTVLKTCDRIPAKEDVIKALQSFVGGYEQIPPMYSAKKIGGRKLVDIARAGGEVERKPVFVEIPEIRILSMELPVVRFHVECAKGTYIRSLCHDCGEKLGCGAAMKSLKRTRVGEFRIEDAYTLSQLQLMKDEGRLEEALLPTEEMFSNLPVFVLSEAAVKLAQNGNPVTASNGHVTDGELKRTEDSQVRVKDENGRFYGIYHWCTEHHRLEPVKMFL